MSFLIFVSSALQKAKIQFKSDFISERQTVLNKAENIHHYLLFHGDLSYINRELDDYMAVTVDDIKRVAKKYLKAKNSTVVTAQPPSATESS